MLNRGLMNGATLYSFTLYTQPLETREPGQPTELGEFFRTVNIAEHELKTSHAPKQLFFHKVGVALAQAVAATSVPKEYWFCELDHNLQRMFDLPPRIAIGAAR